jgi:hypothetical protein
VGSVCVVIVSAWFCIFSGSLRQDLWLKARALVSKN